MNTIGKYKIIRELGSGGFGAVYLCEDQLGLQVAIKIFQPKDDVVAGAATSATADAGEVLKQRFKEEAKILHQLSDNTYIVNFMHYDETEDGIPYYVMPFLDRSLVEEIGKDAFSVGAREDLNPELFPRKLPLTRALEVLEQTAKALRAVHRAGLVHRDIKPANILLDKTGQVQLCDFGIAKLPDVEHSQSGVGMGSRNYMSPEQRESAKHVKASSDIYSLGVIAYRMITGVLPQGRFEDPIALTPSVGQELNELILQSIEFEPSKRPHDANAFLRALKHAAESSDILGAEDDEETGTWIEEGTSNLKDELRPLYEEIKKSWLNDGEIDLEERESFEASAAILDMAPDMLNLLIAQVYEENIVQIKPLQNFMALLDQRIQDQVTENNRQLLLKSKQILINSAKQLKWNKSTVEAMLKKRIQEFADKQGWSKLIDREIKQKTELVEANKGQEHLRQQKQIPLSKNIASNVKEAEPKSVSNMSTERLDRDNYTHVNEFSKLIGINRDKVILMIKDGFYSGRIFDAEWYVNSAELADIDKPPHKVTPKLKTPLKFDKKKLTEKTSKARYVALESFSDKKNIPLEKLRNMINRGKYSSKLLGDAEYIAVSVTDLELFKQELFDLDHTVTVELYATEHKLVVSEVINRIKNGVIAGRKIGSNWCVIENEPNQIDDNDDKVRYGLIAMLIILPLFVLGIALFGKDDPHASASWQPPYTPPTSTYGKIIVRSNVVDDTLYINGQLKGSTGPFAFMAKTGKVQIKVLKQGYAEWNDYYDLGKGETKTIKAELKSNSRLHVENMCNEKVEFAIRYLPKNRNVWRSGGWWTLDGNGSTYISLKGKTVLAEGENVYYYAKVVGKNINRKGGHSFELFGETLSMKKATLTPSKFNKKLLLTCANY